MLPFVTTVVMMLTAFLVGGLPFGWLIGRAVGVDVRAAGSGNIGATNVARTAGRGWGLLTLGLDAVKGAAPTAVGWMLAGPRLAAGAGCAAMLGHVFSPYLGFRGGKGVATAAGVFAVLHPAALGVALLTFALVVFAARRVSVGSVAAAMTLPSCIEAWGASPEVRGLAWAAAAIVLVRHGSNLVRLVKGEEPAFASNPPSPGAEAPKPPTTEGSSPRGPEP